MIIVTRWPSLLESDKDHFLEAFPKAPKKFVNPNSDKEGQDPKGRAKKNQRIKLDMDISFFL